MYFLNLMTLKGLIFWQKWQIVINSKCIKVFYSNLQNICNWVLGYIIAFDIIILLNQAGACWPQASTSLVSIN